MMDLTRSLDLQRRAERLLPGGVDSPVRSFRAVGGVPRWIEHGQGPWLTDVDGNRYLDCIASWGALLLGHAPAAVVAALARAAARGTSFGASTPGELALAERIQQAMPALERLRFVNSGTEATMSAVRVARGFTGRDRILKFAGCYHGHADLFLAQAGSGVATQGLASSAGVPAGAIADTLTLPYNDAAAVAAALERHPGQVAAIIVEPVVGNMGCVPPQPGFLAELRALATRHGALLILDEVMTGFRVAYGGACERFALRPDLVTLGKIIGGGLPVGAYGGRAEIMECVAPLGPVYQAGTLAGNPLAMAAGEATLAAIAACPGLYADLERRGAALQQGLEDLLRAAGLAARVQRVGSMLTLFFTAREVRDFAAAQACDTAAFARLHAALLEQGVLWPPSQFEAAFFGAAHTDHEIEFLLRAFAAALRAL
ncbi:MAG TPA: glutamate-1-semialdehyde 2,1-aminomutase [Terriglobales bacterium]|nr:glutamate-1-semialdehyde 2,1-aminomutase [Terriglobales bacterium]